MLRLAQLLGIFALFCSLHGCLYANVTVPLDNNVDKTEIGEKVGRATAKSMWWLVTWGDAGAAAAADDGDIEVIRHLDMNIKIIFFGFYMKRTTIAYGD